MAIFDALVHRGPDRYVESWMPMDEVLQRVAARFLPAAIDRERGDRRIIAEADNLVDLGMNSTSDLVELHRKLVGLVAYVAIREEVRGPHSTSSSITARPVSPSSTNARKTERAAGRSSKSWRWRWRSTTS